MSGFGFGATTSRGGFTAPQAGAVQKPLQRTVRLNAATLGRYSRWTIALAATAPRVYI